MNEKEQSALQYSKRVKGLPVCIQRSAKEKQPQAGFCSLWNVGLVVTLKIQDSRFGILSSISIPASKEVQVKDQRANIHPDIDNLNDYKDQMKFDTSCYL